MEDVFRHLIDLADIILSPGVGHGIHADHLRQPGQLLRRKAERLALPGQRRLLRRTDDLQNHPRRFPCAVRKPARQAAGAQKLSAGVLRRAGADGKMQRHAALPGKQRRRRPNKLHRWHRKIQRHLGRVELQPCDLPLDCQKDLRQLGK